MSKSVKEAAIDEFKNICRSEFDYLLTEFGFQEDTSPLGEFENEFQIRFVRHDLTVIAEGIHHGSAAVVYLQDSQKRWITPIQLKPDFQPNPSKTPKPKPTSQSDDIKEEARLLLQYGMGLLNGDFSGFERALDKTKTAWEEYESRRRFGVAEQEAVAAFKNGDWSRGIDALQPYENQLSARMLKKLNEARQHFRSNDAKE